MNFRSIITRPFLAIRKSTKTIQLGSMLVRSTLIVVGCQGPVLCGRSTIEGFHKAEVSLLDTRTLSRVNSICEDIQVKALLEEFLHIF